MGFWTYYDCVMTVFSASSFDVVVHDECLPSDGVYVFYVSAMLDGVFVDGYFELNSSADRWMVLVAAVDCLKEMVSE